MPPSGRPPLIAHVVHRLDIGGLENGVVNLVNRIPYGRYRHAVVCMTEYTDFTKRIRRPDVEVIALRKPPGNSVRVQFQLAALYRQLRPSIVHSRNLGTIEAQVAAALVRVPVRVHGEHGWDVGDLDGSSRKYRFLRRVHAPFVQHYIALSTQIADYLMSGVGIDADRVTQIYNGVDTERFRQVARRATLPYLPFADPRLFFVGTVGRMEPVKDPLALVRAFIRALRIAPQAGTRLRLVVVGDGALKAQVLRVMREAGMADLLWLAGARSDVAEILRSIDVFVCPSRAEGISNTILEAMATGLPVIATRVGGNPELVEDGVTGTLVPSGDSDIMAQAILQYSNDGELARRHGAAARQRVEERFSLDAMVAHYLETYDRLLAGRQH